MSSSLSSSLILTTWEVPVLPPIFTKFGLSKFNLYSPEIGLYYLSEILKPIFIVILAFVILGFTSKFQRNENFFKVLFIAISIGFGIFLLKEIIGKLTISLSIDFYISYLMIFLIPFFIGLYQVIKIENE